MKVFCSGTILQGTVRMHEIVISEPGTQLSEYGCGVRCRIDRDVIALDGFDERLGYTVAPGQAVRSSAGPKQKTNAWQEGASMYEVLPFSPEGHTLFLHGFAGVTSDLLT
jgi:hypothetical protein